MRIKELKNWDKHLILETLKEDGVLVIKNFINNENLKHLNTEFDSFMLEPTSDWIKNHPDLDLAKFVDRKSIPENYPVTKKIFSDTLMENLVFDYFQNKSMEANNKIWIIKDEVGVSHIAQDLHFDISRTLKFFLYLNDCTAENGAFKCVPKSHRTITKSLRQNKDGLNSENRDFTRVPEKNDLAVSVEGKAGSLIIFDTDTLHQAGICSKGDRRIMRGQSSVFKYDELKPSLLDKIKNIFSGRAN